MTTIAPVRRVIVGTAGHVDHGKTRLVERLTGVRTDRLPEERERGMTIDVGYAEFALPDGAEVGLLDVPGHERLVRTMVAGATAIDLALLVVAADDGPMPQTREHVEILDLLGVRRGVVALTKVDLVGEEHADLAEEEVRAVLEGTTLEGAAIVRVSSETGEGVEALRRAIVDAVPPSDPTADDPRAFRMPILRAFVAEGSGTVVTGIPVAGTLREGDAVEVLPGRIETRVRGLQVHHRGAVEARAGHRAAIALADAAAGNVRRGMVLAAAGALVPVPRFSARLRTVARAKRALASGAAVRVHVGADDVPARLHLLGGPSLAPGTVAAVELHGERPFLVAPGDRFVLRSANAGVTLGGGVVVERLLGRLPRRREGVRASILARAERIDDPAEAVASVLETSGDRGAQLAEIALRTVLRPDALPRFLDALVAAGRAVRVGRRGRAFSTAGFAALRERVLCAVDGLHAREPGMPFHPLAAVRAQVRGADPDALDDALEDLVASKDLARTPEGGVARAGHRAMLSEEETARAERIKAALVAGGPQPPDEIDLQAALRLTAPVLRRALRVLEARREVFRAGPFWFDAAWVEQFKRRLAERARAQDGFTASEARELAGTTRKFVIPLLEALDDAGFTRRRGDVRTLR